MPMNFTPAGQTPEKPTTGPAKYVPHRMTPSMVGNTAPVPGDEEGQRPAQRPAPGAAARGAPGAGEEEQPEGGEGEGDQQARVDMTRRMGMLSEKDRKARERIAAATAAEARLKAVQDALDVREKALKIEEDRRAEWRRNPKKLLQDNGYVPEAAMQFMLNDEKLTPDQQLAVNFDERIAKEREATEAQLAQLRQEQADAREKERLENERAEKEQLAQQEQDAIADLQTDIGDIIGEDTKSFALLLKAEKNGPGRGVGAVYDRVQAISDELYQQNGRRPPITTKLLERAAREVEAAARKELQETMADPELAAALGMGGRIPAPRPQTLTNRMAPAVSTGQRVDETDAEKRERVKAMISPLLRGGRAR